MVFGEAAANLLYAGVPAKVVMEHGHLLHSEKEPS